MINYPWDWDEAFRPEGAVGGAMLKADHDRIMLRETCLLRASFKPAEQTRHQYW